MQQNNPIDIACNIDDSYVIYCSTMLTSLFENNRDLFFRIHIIAGSLEKDGKAALSDIAQSYQNEISFYHPDKELLKYCPTHEGSYISLAAYYRCFLDTILPVTIDKVLYLDSDLIVNDSITDLWETDITQYAVGVVEDMWCEKEHFYTWLQYDRSYSFFNSGVLLINLKYWRENSISEKVSSFIQNLKENDRYFDQDILNKIFHANKRFLPYRWNMQTGFFKPKPIIRESVWEQLDLDIQNPGIIHFTGKRKPWHFGSIHPYRNIYFHYLDKTIWKGQRPPFQLYKYIEVNTNNVLYKLGILRPRYKKISVPTP